MPRRLPDMSMGEYIGTLQDYMVETAVARGDLEECRFHAHEALRLLRDEWRDLRGYEMGQRLKTQADHDRAKAAARPDVAGGMNAAKWYVDRLTEQIERLGGMSDDEVVSRVYSMQG